jgi:hypothetical protein
MRGSTWLDHGALRLVAAAGFVVAFAGCPKTQPEPPPPAPSYSISGTVSGAIAEGVTVRVIGGRSAKTGPTGAYTITGLHDGTYTVEASLAGYAFTPPTRSVTVSGANVVGQNFTSLAGIAIQGTVTGSGSAGSTVTLVGPAPATTATTTTTAADGSFTFPNVAAGSYVVTPSRAGGWTFSPANCLVTVAGTTLTGLNFAAIAPTHALSGKVTGAVTAGVAITLSGDADAVAMTDATGSYYFLGLASGGYVVTPSRAGYAFTPADHSVTIGTADVTGQDFAAVATHKIAGVITGDAYAGVTVFLSGAANAGVTTDGAGYFEFTGLLDGDYTLTPSLDGYTLTPTTLSVTLAGADMTTANFTTTPAPTYSVSGAVAGDVLAGVTMSLQGAETFLATTDATGAYAFAGVPPGDYLLVPSREDYTFDPASRLVAVRTANVTGQSFTASVDPSARTITGTVTGDVVASVTMTLSGPAPAIAPTDAAGGFAFRGLADGLYTVTPSLTGYAFTPANCLVTVSGPSVTNVAFTSKAVRTISGKVSGAVTAGVFVALSGDAVAVTVTAADGSYSFPGLPNGSYTVTPALIGYVFGPEEASVTLLGANVPGVDFIAVAAHTIAGTISGDVLEGVTVTLSGAASATATTDIAGAYTFSGLPDGSYVVTPSLEGYTFDPQFLPVALAGADVLTANFVATLVPTYSVSGTISGAVVDGVTLTLSGAATGTATSDPAGAYVFTGLENGSYMVIPSLTGYTFTPASRAFRVNGAAITGQSFTSAVAPP